MAASYNGRQWPEYEESYLSVKSGFFNIEQKTKGGIESASLGVSVQPIPKLSLGLGWTKWFGKDEWGEESSHYTGTNWQLGFLGHFNRLALGAVLYFPLQLTDQSHQQNQKFKGAMNIGVAYELASRWTLGLGYSYQPKFTVEYQQWRWRNDVEYEPSSKLSFGIEYAHLLKKARLPLYLGYQAQWLPKSSELIPYPAFVISTDRSALNHQWVLGASLLFDTIGFHIALQERQSAFYIRSEGGSPAS